LVETIFWHNTQLPWLFNRRIYQIIKTNKKAFKGLF